MRNTKLRERLVLVAKKKTGIMDHQRSPVPLLRYTLHMLPPLSPHSPISKQLLFLVQRSHREAHTSYEPADSFLFLIREPGPQKERDEARAGRRQWRGQSNSFGEYESLNCGGNDGRRRRKVFFEEIRIIRRSSKVELLSWDEDYCDLSVLESGYENFDTKIRYSCTI